MDFEKAIRPLGRFTPMLEKVPQAVRDAVFDIRISVDKPVLLCCGDRILFLREDGDTAQYFSQNNVTATREDVEEIFLRLCGYSGYSHMEEIRGGFVSADRALRVGIGGTAVIEKQVSECTANGSVSGYVFFSYTSLAANNFVF